ncbi:glycogen synthase [Paenibacillus cisolokensis]|uniref:Glycogen synthase n=1 Tax=Paenibacillus cisolokensis TaxID=1658519 RepID=A0ABQ4N5U7_9BACL|nr:glycogen synthase GlgA [Paenibacillus cisolokensis]GIQ63539.1 glycogen synthase [Paenibacillus cisolokensis]
MNILFAASEAVPLVKTGGLADVTGALPLALRKLGVRAGVILPKYEEIAESHIARFETVCTFTVQLGWRKQYCGLLRAAIGGIDYYLIDNEYYFKRRGLYGYGDDAERFVFFSFAVVEALRYLDVRPDILHCHDWQTALVPFLLKTRYAHDPVCRGIATVFTIHNLKYQGVFSKELMLDLLGAGEEVFRTELLEFYGAANCMKSGLVCADKLTTVSPTYAEEIQTEWYGEKLDGLLRRRSGDLSGIVNGIDTALFDPMNDPALVAPYRHSLDEKRRNKTALQRELGLPEAENVPLIGIVSRLVEQKGFDLLAHILDEALSEPAQWAVLGAGERRYEELFREAAARRPDKIAVRLGYDDGLARRIYAGSDLYLMPSKFEPCGLSQLIALRYLSVPIVRETGGLKDTVLSYNEYTGEGNGFTFAHYNAHDLLFTIRRALKFYADPAAWGTIAANAAKRDYGWDRSAKQYLALYDELVSN